jgi:hypothetical protein
MCWHCSTQSVTGEPYDDAWEESHELALRWFKLYWASERVWDKRNGQYRSVITVELPTEEEKP